MSSFEFNDKAEEWLDVTPKEELLNHELTRVKHALEKRSMELLEANMTVDLFMGHKALLENQKSSLQEELSQTKDAVSTVQQTLQETVDREDALKQELTEMKTVTEQHANELQQSLSSCKNELENSNIMIGNLNDHIKDMTMMHQKEKKESSNTVESLSHLVAQLKQKVSSLENTSKTQQNALQKSEQKLKESISVEDKLRKEIAYEKNKTAKYSKDLEGAKTNIGSVAVLAEDLRAQKLSLEHSLAKQTQATTHAKKQLEQSQERENSLNGEIFKLKASFEQHSTEMEASLSEKTFALEESRQRVDALQAALENSKEQNGILEGEQENLKELLARETALSKELSEQKEMLQAEMKTREESVQEDVEKARGSVAREQALREELAKQKAAFELRLGKINAILGVTPMEEVARTAFPAMSEFLGAQTKDSLGRSLAPSLSIPLLGRVKFL